MRSFDLQMNKSIKTCFICKLFREICFHTHDYDAQFLYFNELGTIVSEVGRITVVAFFYFLNSFFFNFIFVKYQ